MPDEDDLVPTPFMMPVTYGRKKGKGQEEDKGDSDTANETTNLYQPQIQEDTSEKQPVITDATGTLQNIKPERPQTLEQVVKKSSPDTEKQAAGTPFEMLASIDLSIQKCTKDYFHSAAFAEYNDPITNTKVAFNLRDIIEIGAIVGADLLMTGNTGGGKTMVANRMAIALFGHMHYSEKTCTPGTREADFTDLNFDTITKGGKLREAIEAPPVLTNPCVVINELNRMPEVTQNKLIPYFDKKYEYLGAEFQVGVSTDKGLYQFRTVTINEGDKFGGTASIDAAVRDRLIIEIPMDLFPLAREDRYRKRKSHTRSLEQIKDKGHSDEVFSLLEICRSIDLSEEAELFLGYVEGMNNCVKSNTKSKMGVDLGYLCQNLCSGCHNIQYDEHICNNVLAPSERGLDKLRDVSQGFALLRAYKALFNENKNNGKGRFQKLGDSNTLTEQTDSTLFENLRVDVNDIIAASPFVFYSKINVNPLWVQKHYQGNKWAAVNSIVNTAYKRFQKFLRTERDLATKYFTNKPLSNDETRRLEDYAVEKDAWAYRIGG